MQKTPFYKEINIDTDYTIKIRVDEKQLIYLLINNYATETETFIRYSLHLIYF